MRLVFIVALAALLVSALGCGGLGGLGGAGSGCSLDVNGDGQLTEADFQGMTEAQVQGLQTQLQSNPLSFLPCLPLLEAAGGSLPGSGS